VRVGSLEIFEGELFGFVHQMRPNTERSSPWFSPDRARPAIWRLQRLRNHRTVLYCCNQRADAVTVVRVDRATGALSFTGHYAPVGNPSAIVLLDLA
jgi:hypothetical protein